MMVYPVAGRAVRDPRNFQLLPDEGREVPDGDAFWLRRLRDGDVTTEPPIIEGLAIEQPTREA